MPWTSAVHGARSWSKEGWGCPFWSKPHEEGHSPDLTSLQEGKEGAQRPTGNEWENQLVSVSSYTGRQDLWAFGDNGETLGLSCRREPRGPHCTLAVLWRRKKGWKGAGWEAGRGKRPLVQRTRPVFIGVYNKGSVGLLHVERIAQSFVQMWEGRFRRTHLRRRYWKN